MFYEPDGYQYFTANFEPDGFDCMRDKFLGMYHTEDNPVAVINGKCSGSFEKGGNHCGSLQKNIVLQPGEEKRFIFMLGEGNREAGKVMREKYSNFENVDRAFAELHNYWERKCSKLQIETPNEGMNTLINTWTLYQSEINVMFSRFASFIEVGGRTGLGYRDTAQDAMTIPHSNPGKCRQRIEELLNGLVSKGYGLHLFDPAWFEKKEETSEDEFKSPTVIPTSEKERMPQDQIPQINMDIADFAHGIFRGFAEGEISDYGSVEILDQKVMQNGTLGQIFYPKKNFMMEYF